MSGTTRVTYVAVGRSTSTRASGLVKVGQSDNPAKRTRSLSCELLGTTALGEGVLREMLRPWLVPHEALRGRGIETGYVRGGEWYRDCPAVRMLAAWAIEFRPERDEAGHKVWRVGDRVRHSDSGWVGVVEVVHRSDDGGQGQGLLVTIGDVRAGGKAWRPITVTSDELEERP